MRLRVVVHGREHHVTIPRHAALKVGTLNGILVDVAAQLELGKAELIEELLDL